MKGCFETNFTDSDWDDTVLITASTFDIGSEGSIKDIESYGLGYDDLCDKSTFNFDYKSAFSMTIDEVCDFVTEKCKAIVQKEKTVCEN